MRGMKNGRYIVATALILVLGIPALAVGFGEGRNLIAGKRNPSSRALSAETEIISSNGTYSTRQSNLRNGDGGGAIYGCRSNPGSEPCIRANNLKGGRAFEFSTTGNQAGQITTGNPSGAPFVTNATGVATGLNADKVDGQDAAAFAAANRFAFAAVTEAGGLAAGSGATAANRVAEGANFLYTVTFNRDVSACSATASALGAASDFGFGVQPGSGASANTVQVRATNARGFHLQVIC